jgi:hypothetical protein
MSNGSYDLNLGSEILILGGDIRSRSWPNIGDSYGNSKLCLLSSALSSASMLVSELASGIRLLEFNLVGSKIHTKIADKCRGEQK